jgi:hypothetical protein
MKSDHDLSIKERVRKTTKKKEHLNGSRSPFGGAAKGQLPRGGNYMTGSRWIQRDVGLFKPFKIPQLTWRMGLKMVEIGCKVVLLEIFSHTFSCFLRERRWKDEIRQTHGRGRRARLEAEMATVPT